MQTAISKATGKLRPLKLTLFISLVGLLALLSACRTTRPNSSLKDAESRDAEVISPLECREGEAAYFLMKEVPDLDLSFFQVPSGEASLMPLNEMITRLDVCMVNDEPHLKRVLFGMIDRPDSIDVDANAKIEGLKDIIFNNDYSKLEVLVPYGKYKGIFDDIKSESNEALLIRGARATNAALALLVSKVGGQYAVSTDRLLKFATVGKFEFFEPPKGSACVSNSDSEGTFTLGTATFTWRGKTSGGPSAGAAPSLCSITVIDKATELGDKAGVTVEMEFPFKGNEYYQFTSNHHSVCDSFVLKLPNVEYAVTASADGVGGDCREPVRGAPEGTKGATRFIFRYGDKVVEGVSKSCRHPTLQCP